MEKMVFINLPVVDLDRSIAFYRAMGFTQNPQFSDETGACMVWSATIHVMILTHTKWKTFTDRPISDRASSEVMLAFNVERDEIDRLLALVASNGGLPDVNPPQDHGFMRSRAFADPDGHVWEAFWMDPAFAEGQPQEEEA